MTATDAVYLSDLLQVRYAALHDELAQQLARYGIALRKIAGTRDIWCRDYMPIPIGEGRFVQFRYTPDYLADEPQLITPPKVADVVATCIRSELVVDGGNVVRRGATAIVTDKIFSENPSVPRGQLVDQLRATLEVEHLVVIPTEPGDVFGHADGVLHLLDDRSALVNDYGKAAPGYGRRLGRALRERGIEVIPMPYAPDLSDRGDVPSATGVYVNFLETAEVIFVPVYGIASDEAAVRAVEAAFVARTIVQIDCQAIAPDGGSLHCATWQPAA